MEFYHIKKGMYYLAYVSSIDKKDIEQSVYLTSPFLGEFQIKRKQLRNPEILNRIRFNDLLYFQIEYDENLRNYGVSHIKEYYEDVCFYDKLINLFALKTQKPFDANNETVEDSSRLLNQLLKIPMIKRDGVPPIEELIMIEEALKAAFSNENSLIVNDFPIIRAYEIQIIDNEIAKYLLNLSSGCDEIRLVIAELITLNMPENEQIKLWLEDLLPKISPYVLSPLLAKILRSQSYTDSDVIIFEKFIKHFSEDMLIKISADILEVGLSDGHESDYLFGVNYFSYAMKRSQQFHIKAAQTFSRFLDDNIKSLLWKDNLYPETDSVILKPLITRILKSPSYTDEELEILGKFCKQFSFDELLSFVSELMDSDPPCGREVDYLFAINFMGYIKTQGHVPYENTLKLIDQKGSVSKVGVN